MNKITLVFFIIFINASAQEYLDPILRTSFGLNHHTNRDISYFSEVDNLGNVYSVGTTERDSSFTDIITTKFDSGLNLIWQKRYSSDTELSFDFPLKTYVDSNNNLIIIGESLLSQSFYDASRFLFIVKYDPNGEELWHTTLGNTDLSAYPEYADFNSSFDDDVLRIIYNPIDWETSQGNGADETKYVRIENDGSIVEEYSIYFPNFGVESTYKNGIYYSLVRVDRPDGYSDYYIRRVGPGIAENYLLNDQPNYVQENFSQVIDQIQLQVDDNENLYLIKPNIEGYGNSLSYTKVNKSGQIEYSKNTSLDYYLLGSYMDTDDKICVIYEDTSLSKIIKKKLDDQGNDFETLEVDFSNLSGSKLNDDHTLFVSDETDRLYLFSKDLNPINSFAHTPSYFITDASKLDDSNIIVTGTTYNKMYPESDFNTQDDIVVEKLSPTQILNSYSYSGEGTSKAFQQSLLIDHDDNYLVLSQEKMGPDNFNPGGSRGPLNKSLSKYDSDLNLLWRIEFPDLIIGYDNAKIDSENNIYINVEKNNYPSPNTFELYKLSPDGTILFQVPSYQNKTMYFGQNNNLNIVSFPIYNQNTFDDDTFIYTYDSNNGNFLGSTQLSGLLFVESYLSPSGDSYLYLFTGANTLGDYNPEVQVYKNLEFLFTVQVEEHSLNGGIGPVDVTDNGDLIFGSSSRKLHKITLSNSYSYVSVANFIRRLKILASGKIFTIEDYASEEGKIKVYNDDLTLFAENALTPVYYQSEIMEIKDYIWLNNHNYYGDFVMVFDENFSLTDKFEIPSSMQQGGLDSNNNFILTGKFGNTIFTYHEYEWYRGFLHKYDYTGPTDIDGDGVSDRLDSCPDTPNGESVDQDGCSQSQLDDDNDGVTNNLDDCPNTPEGEAVDANGCSDTQLDDDNDGVNNANDLCPNTTAGSTVDVNGCFTLPTDNFSIETIGETCPGKNNAQIIITAQEDHNYFVTINGTDYNFNDTLTINDLSPGDYDFCIVIPSEDYQQCFFLTLVEGVDISGSIFYDSGNIIVDVSSGTAPYSVYVNDNFVFQTLSSKFTVETKQGDIVKIITDKACEGNLTTRIDLTNEIFVFPNPSKGNFKIALPKIQNSVPIEIYNIQSQLIMTSIMSVEDGYINLSLKENPNGLYFVKMYLDEPVVLKLVKY